VVLLAQGLLANQVSVAQEETVEIDSDESRVESERHRMTVLIAARPGRMRESLTVLLRMVDDLDLIGQADDSSSAKEMISAHRPRLVLLDTNLPGEGVPTLLAHLRSDGASGSVLVLADSIQDRQFAIAAGADAALVKGYRTATLIEMVEDLLPCETGTQGFKKGENS
jgi:DNA-binding NarL/FixJ family response regulator